LVSAPDSTISVDSLQEAAKYKIGAYKNNAVTQSLEGQNIPLVIALRDQENARKLAKGQIDLWATDDPAGRYMARQEGITGLRVVLKMNQAELYLALNKDTPDEVVQRLQKALDELRSEGFVEEMTGNYL
jgi:polar amino acid transport system substrate-binding protein